MKPRGASVRFKHGRYDGIHGAISKNVRSRAVEAVGYFLSNALRHGAGSRPEPLSILYAAAIDSGGSALQVVVLDAGTSVSARDDAARELQQLPARSESRWGELWLLTRKASAPVTVHLATADAHLVWRGHASPQLGRHDGVLPGFLAGAEISLETPQSKRSEA